MSPGVGLPADSSSFTSLRSAPHRPDPAPLRRAITRATVVLASGVGGQAQ